MTAPRLILASASPARLALLRNAGLDPMVIVSGAEEGDVALTDTRAAVATLARRKAEIVARLPTAADALVIGCDSLLDFEGLAYGKPATTADAVDLWKRRRGQSGVLLTGHHLIDTTMGRAASDVAATTVRFGAPTDAEIAAYVATDEPLAVAGAFTIDGRAAPFVDGIDGDPGNVIGLSLPLLRRLLGQLDVEITDLWT